MASSSVEYRCFVGGLAWATDNHALEKAFSSFGEIVEAKIVNDRETGRSLSYPLSSPKNQNQTKKSATPNPDPIPIPNPSLNESFPIPPPCNCSSVPVLVPLPVMSFSRSMRSQSLSNPPPLAEKITEEPITTKTAQSTVTCFYQANIAGFWRNVTVLWCKNLMNHTLNVTIHSLRGDFHCNYKIDVKPWNFWSKKGYKSLDLDGCQIDIYWDVRSAKFSSGPEPYSDFYVALVAEEEVVLLLGDYKKKAYKRTKSRPALVEAFLIYKKENVFAKKCFSTRARFDDRRKECDIVVEISSSGAKDPEMWISIDGIVLVQVKNLQWKFRGNQTVVVNQRSVQVLWDVHDWLFTNPGTGHGLFIFKPAPPESESDMEGSGGGGGGGGGGLEPSDDGSIYYSTRSMNSSHQSEFCLFLYAWKLE